MLFVGCYCYILSQITAIDIGIVQIVIMIFLVLVTLPTAYEEVDIVSESVLKGKKERNSNAN